MRTWVVFLLLLISPVFNVLAQSEQILNYDTHIRVNKDATLTIHEKITVSANNNQIRRGIYRDIPLSYRDTYGNKINLDIHVIGVTKNGQKEPFHTQQTRQRIQIYAGQQNVILKPGQYQYEITYLVKHAISYYKKFDELYWNVTGNEWQFAIKQAKVTLELPQGTPIQQHAGYTGLKGTKGQNFTSQVLAHTIEYQTTFPLNPREGLTIAVAWPKGVVFEPSLSEKFLKVLKDSIGALYAFVGFLLIFGFYLMCWVYVGRDPLKGTIIPLYEPPEGYSPAAMHFISHMGFKTVHNAFTAALVHLGVKGFVKLSSNQDEFKAIKLKKGDNSLGVGERAIMEHLFKKGEAVLFTQGNQEVIRNTLSEFKHNIQKELSGIYFKTNRFCFVMALIFTFIYIAGWVMILKLSPDILFLLLWLSIWTFGTCTLIYMITRNAKAYFRSKKESKMLKPFIFITLFSIPFVIAEVLVLSIVAYSAGWLATFFLGLTIGQHVLFWELLKRPTLYGRKVMDKIDGFKLFLSVANKDELESFKSPELTPHLFERYLPYAMALDLEKNWSQRFESTLRRLDNQASGSSYSPKWYSGSQSFSSMGAYAFSSALSSSLSSSVRTSSSSSSGSGGGGSSGGGGGGGGGGGW